MESKINFANANLTEKVNLKIAKKLSKINFEQFKILFNKSTTKRHNDYNVKNEFTKLKTYCKNIVSSKNNHVVNYNYVDGKSIGRLQSKNPSIQRLYNGFRGVLCDGVMIDVDMKNCHCILVIDLCEKNDIKYNYLADYVNNRDNKIKEIMDDYGFSKSEAKSALLSCLNDINIKKSVHKKRVKKGFLKDFDGEMSRIIKELYDIYKKDDKYKKYLSNSDYNKEGKFTNLILCDMENTYLNRAINKCIEKKIISLEDVAVLMFDGFMIYDNGKSNLKKKIIDILDSEFEKENMKWDVKDHNIELKEHIDNLEIDNKKSYEDVKAEFEENHFMIEHPLMFGRTYKKGKYLEYGLYNKMDFKDLVKKNKYVYLQTKETEKDIKYIPIDVFDEWIRDENIRSYKNINFVPKTNLEDINKSKEYFNTFQGFEGEYLDNKIDLDGDKEKSIIETFKNHIGLLTNYDEKSIEYLTQYVADIIQNPDKLPSVAIMFKSKQGFGKDTFLNIISRMIGDKYLYRTANLDDVFGSFNTSIKDKIILQLNELEGKDGFCQKEKIKNLITEEFTNINEKKIKQYKQNNYIRMFIMTNNISPIEIPADDRRFVIFKAHNNKPNQEYFNKLWKLYEDDFSIKVLYEYFKNYKLTLSLRNDRPITNAYKDLQDNCVNPIYIYLNELFIKNNIREYYDDDEFKTHKKTGNILIKANDFYQNYKNYLSSEDLTYIKITYRLVKSLLADIDIDKKQVKINGENNDYYIFNKEIIKNRLEHYNFDNEVLEYDDDDFE